MAWWSLRSIGLTLVVVFSGVLSAAFSLAAIFFCGESVDAIVLSMPSLVYVLAISGAVHLINYLKDAVIEGGLEGSTERAVIHAFKPAYCVPPRRRSVFFRCMRASLPPFESLVSIRLGVFLMLGILYIFLPAVLHLMSFGKRWGQ